MTKKKKGKTTGTTAAANKYVLPGDNLPTLDKIEGMGRDKILRIRLFHPVGAATWFVVAGEPDTKGRSIHPDDFIFWGCAAFDGINWDWGYFSLRELQAMKVMGLCPERDRAWTPTRTSEQFPTWR